MILHGIAPADFGCVGRVHVATEAVLEGILRYFFRRTSSLCIESDQVVCPTFLSISVIVSSVSSSSVLAESDAFSLAVLKLSESSLKSL